MGEMTLMVILWLISVPSQFVKMTMNVMLAKTIAMRMPIAQTRRVRSPVNANPGLTAMEILAQLMYAHPHVTQTQYVWYPVRLLVNVTLVLMVADTLDSVQLLLH